MAHISLSLAELTATMQRAAQDGADVIYWLHGCQLDWLRAEDDAHANAMYTRIGAAIAAGLYAGATEGHSFVAAGQTYFPLLVHHVDDTEVNPAHFLFTQIGVSATPYYFRTAQKRDAVLASLTT
jgi:hypothetical protein